MKAALTKIWDWSIDLLFDIILPLFTFAIGLGFLVVLAIAIKDLLNEAIP